MCPSFGCTENLRLGPLFLPFFEKFWLLEQICTYFASQIELTKATLFRSVLSFGLVSSLLSCFTPVPVSHVCSIHVPLHRSARFHTQRGSTFVAEDLPTRFLIIFSPVGEFCRGRVQAYEDAFLKMSTVGLNIVDLPPGQYPPVPASAGCFSCCPDSASILTSVVSTWSKMDNKMDKISRETTLKKALLVQWKQNAIHIWPYYIAIPRNL